MHALLGAGGRAGRHGPAQVILRSGVREADQAEKQAGGGGVRHVQAAEQHRGMMLAIAFESVVKLVALLAVGPFVIFWLFDGPGDLMARIAAAQIGRAHV